MEPTSEAPRGGSLPFLLAIGGLALAFLMVATDYDSAAAWCAVTAALIAAAFAHELGHRRELKPKAKDSASSSRSEDGNKAVPVSSIDGE